MINVPINRLKQIPRNEWGFWLIIIAAGLVIFLIGKDGWFLNDDFFLLDQAKSLKLLSPFYDGKFYRPLPHLTYFIQMKLFGLRFAPYLALNILIHLCNTFLLYILLTMLSKQSGFKYPGIFAKLLTAIFFIHPTGIEVVEWSSARTDSLAGLFILLTLIAFIKDRYLLSLLSYALALFSKEIAITVLLPVFILTIQYKKKKVTEIFCFILVTGIYLFLRYLALRGEFFTSIEQHILPPAHRIAHLLFYIFIPYFNYCIRLLGIVTPMGFLIVFIPILLAISVYLIVKARDSLYIVASFWGFMVFAVASYILGLRYLYLPLIFGVLLLHKLDLTLNLSKMVMHYVNSFLVLVLFLYIHIFGLQMEAIIDHADMVRAFLKDLEKNKNVLVRADQTVFAIDYLPLHVTHFLNDVSFSGMLRLYDFKANKGRIIYTVNYENRLVYSDALQAMKPGIKQNYYVSPPQGYLIFFKPESKLWRIDRIIANF